MLSSLERKDQELYMHNEYVESFNASSVERILLPTICAFLNTDGGVIYFGYNGRNACDLKAPATFENRIKSIIESSKTLKDYRNCIEVYTDLIEGKEVVCVLVDKSDRSNGYVPIDGKIYFRIEGKNASVSKDKAAYTEKIALFGFPEIEDYSPKLTVEKKELARLKKKNGVILKTIGEVKNDKNNRIFKTLDLEAALLSLDNGNMRFYEPSNWDDDYESRFYNAHYFEKGSPVKRKKTPFLYATCFASNPNNEASWVLYSHNKTGLASRCVQFELNLKELRKQLVTNAKKKMIYFARVNYVGAFMINHLHESKIDGLDNKNYHSYFDNFSLECYLNLLLLKRNLFEHEKEVRLFIIPNPRTNESKNIKTRKIGKKKYEGNEKPLYTDIKIDWSDIIEKVRIDKSCSEYEKSILRNKLNGLFKKKEKKLRAAGIQYDKDKLMSKFKLVEYDPYEDESLSTGPIDINTN